MAVDFDAGEYLKRDSVSVTAAPLSMSALLYRDTAGLVNLSLMVDGATANGWAVGITGGGLVFLEVSVGGVFDYAVTGSALAVSTWGHIGGLVTSATSRQAILNGAKSTANTSNNTPSGTINRFAIGARYQGSGGIQGQTDGRMAEVGVWNRALTDAEWAFLYVSPGVFRSPLFLPSGLVEYASLRTDTTMNPGAAMTTVGSVTFPAHPTVLYPWGVKRATWRRRAA